MQGAVGGAADVRVAARHPEFAARLRRDPDLTGLLQVEETRDPLERIRELVPVNLLINDTHAEDVRIALPNPFAAEIVDYRSAAGRLGPPREAKTPRMADDRVAAVTRRRQPGPPDDVLDAGITEQECRDALDGPWRRPLHIDLRGAHVGADHDLVRPAPWLSEPRLLEFSEEPVERDDRPSRVAEHFAMPVIGCQDDVGIA